MTDRQGRVVDYLRVSVTDRCNLRCVYCMPPQGVAPVPHEEVLTYEEIIRVCDCAARLGVRKIKLTGGEPLVRKGLNALIRGLKRIDGIEQVTMTSNGILLADQLGALADAGLDAVNISLDTLDPVQFEQITRHTGLETVLAAMDEALEHHLRVKVNVVPVRELNEDQLLPLAELARERPLEVRFIELMPIGCGKGFAPIATAEIRQRLEAAYGALTSCDQRLGNGPAEYVSLSGFQGHIGFISAVSTRFCAQCNRMRLTSTGFLKPCLHGSGGIELRSLLRSGMTDAVLTELVRQGIEAKPAHHQFGGSCLDEERRNMVQIGG